jgi:hypothetical protein
MDSRKERRQPSVVVAWPLLYANKKFIGQGTMLKVSADRGCHVAGTMPVAAGMVLRVWISPAHRDEALYVKEARVLWARRHEFWLDLRQVDSQDHQRLIRFLGTQQGEDVSGNPIENPIVAKRECPKRSF